MDVVVTAVLVGRQSDVTTIPRLMQVPLVVLVETGVLVDGLVLVLVRGVVAVHAVVLALGPGDARLLGAEQLSVLEDDHGDLVFAVGSDDGRRAATAAALVEGRTGRYVGGLALAEALGAEERGTTVGRRRDDRGVGVLARGQTRLGDVAAGEAVGLADVAVDVVVVVVGRVQALVQLRDYLALEFLDVLAQATVVLLYTRKREIISIYLFVDKEENTCL